MTITMNEVLSYLNRDEPNYNEAAQKLGPDALPYLIDIVRGPDEMLASKATYLASLIESDRSAEVVRVASQSPSPIVRVAAASGLRNLAGPAANAIMDSLVEDKDIGVRKVTINSASISMDSVLNKRVESIARSDPDPMIRELANKALNRTA